MMYMSQYMEKNKSGGTSAQPTKPFPKVGVDYKQNYCNYSYILAS